MRRAYINGKSQQVRAHAGSAVERIYVTDHYKLFLSFACEDENSSKVSTKSLNTQAGHLYLIKFI